MPSGNFGDLQQALASNAYPLVNVQAISLSGPRDAQAAMQAVQESFCKVVLDPQFVDIGVSRNQREWRIVLARPLLTGRLGDWQTEGQKVLALINTARAQPRQCGTQAFAAAAPLTWDATLAIAAESHTRDMANTNYFDHMNRDGKTPGDRAELAAIARNGSGKLLLPGKTRRTRWSMAGWPAPGIART